MAFDQYTQVLTKQILQNSKKSCESICNSEQINSIEGTCLSHVKKEVSLLKNQPVYKNIHCHGTATSGNLCYCIMKPAGWTNITNYSEK